MAKHLEQQLTQLYRAYLQQKQKTDMEQLRRILFHDTRIDGDDCPAPLPTAPGTKLFGDMNPRDQENCLRTLPVCIQEMYGLQPLGEQPGPRAVPAQQPH